MTINLMSKIIIGLAGKIASGKGTASDHIVKTHNAVNYRYSDPLKEALGIFDIEATRQNLQTFSTILRKNFSEDVLARAMFKRSKEAANDNVVIDGIRRIIDFANFQLLDNFYLIYIEVDQNIRYERYTKRDQSPGDATMSFNEFKEKDEAESEQQVEKVKSKAHFTVNNNGSYEELRSQIDDIIQKLHES